MNPNGYVVQRGPEACRNTVAWFAKNVGTPNDVRIFRLERWQHLVEAVANHSVEFDIGLNGKALDIRVLHGYLPASRPDGLTLVVDSRARQNPAQPSPNCLGVA